jgi:hypothetical protein
MTDSARALGQHARPLLAEAGERRRHPEPARRAGRPLDADRLAGAGRRPGRGSGGGRR